MTTQINSDNIQPDTLATLAVLTITNVQITDSSYVVLDDTAISTSGGYIKISGGNFVNGCQVIIGAANATSVTFVNSSQLNVQVGAQSAGTVTVYVVNPDGTVALRVNGLTFSAAPSWVTGSTLPGGTKSVAYSTQLSATLATVYQLQAGSSLPPGLTLSSSGLISGTVTVISVTTVYNFTIVAIDADLQDSPRAFSLTITV